MTRPFLDPDIRSLINTVCGLERRADTYDRLATQIERLVNTANDEYSLRLSQAVVVMALMIDHDGKGIDMARIGTDQWRTTIWYKAARSAQGNGCVALARVGDTVGIRDDKRGFDGSVLQFTPLELELFIGAAKDGEFDHLVRG
jgi:hypothetical protein